MASRFLQVLLSATVVAFIAVGCGNRGFNPPSDEDMIHNFYAHEDAFNEITEILLNCPYGDIYPPFYPIGSATDSLCLSSLGNEKCTRLDSLLASVGGRRLYFKSRHTLWQVEHGDFSSIPPIEELPDTIVPSISIIYYSAGWSVGPSVDKQYDPIPCAYLPTDRLWLRRCPRRYVRAKPVSRGFRTARPSVSSL